MLAGATQGLSAQSAFALALAPHMNPAIPGSNDAARSPGNLRNIGCSGIRRKEGEGARAARRGTEAAWPVAGLESGSYRCAQHSKESCHSAALAESERIGSSCDPTTAGAGDAGDDLRLAPEE